MTNFEFGPCSIEEYTKDEPQRIMESHLEKKTDPYTLMISFGNIAFKQPVDVWKAEKQESGLYLVEFDVLNGDMEVVREDAEALFLDGYMQKPYSEDGVFSYSLRGQLHTIETGYFRNARLGNSGPDDQAVTSEDIEAGLQQLLDHAREQELVIAR